MVVDPSDYAEVAKQISATGDTTLELRRKLAAKVFARTAAYDAAIAAHLQREFNLARLPACHFAQYFYVPGAATPLRRKSAPKGRALRRFHEFFQQLHGKELSYNNILDLTAAANLMAEFADDPPTLAILKHTNPCGVGQGANLREAWDKAFATDQQAPFGGIIAVNHSLDDACTEAIAEIFSEVIIAPGFSAEALAVLQKKKNLRLLKVLKSPFAARSLDVRSVGANSYLLQERDLKTVTRANLKVVTRRLPTDDEWRAMLFGWRVVKHVKSNAIVYVAADRTLGIGAGQMSRVDASRIAVWKAGEARLLLKEQRGLQRRVFPVPGRFDGGGGSWRNGGDSTGRFGA